MEGSLENTRGDLRRVGGERDESWSVISRDGGSERRVEMSEAGCVDTVDVDGGTGQWVMGDLSKCQLQDNGR